MDYKELAESLQVCANDTGGCKGCKHREENHIGCVPKILEEASTAITELLERAERAEKQLAESGWIRIEDRKPTECCLVIIARKLIKKVVLLDTAVYFLGNFYVKGKRVKGVTHWMNMPKPPKE